MSRAFVLVCVCSLRAFGANPTGVEWNTDGAPAPRGWIRHVDPDRGLAFYHPPSAKITTTRTGVRIADGARATIEIDVARNSERWGTSRGGGHAGREIDLTITGPGRSAHCHGPAADLDAAATDSAICGTLVLARPPRRPHVEVAIEATGIAGTDKLLSQLRALETELDACWRAFVAGDPGVSVGDIIFDRTLEAGEVVMSSRGASNFYESESLTRFAKTDALGACASPILERVPITTSAKHAKLKIIAACLWY